MFPVDRAALQRPDLLAGRQPRTINMSTIGDDLLRDGSPAFGPKIEALVVYNSNPVAVAPESGKVVQGFAREDLFTVVLEHFQTDTADYADYILPATTQLEHWDVHTSLRPHRRAAEPPAIAPWASARPTPRSSANWPRAWAFPNPASDTTSSCAARPMATRWTLRCCWIRALPPLPVPDAPFAEGGFPTPSGKCEFFSQRLAARGWTAARPPAQSRGGGSSDAVPAGHDLAAGAQLP
jgi:hypothetical protein